MLVERLMNSKVVSVTPDTPLLKVWQSISSKHTHGLLIVDKKNRLVGIISEEDLLGKLFPGYDDISSLLSETEDDEIKEKISKLKTWTAEKIMSRTVYFTRADTSIMRALSRMLVRKVRQLPVLDDNDRVVGVISKADIFRGLFRPNIYSRK